MCTYVYTNTIPISANTVDSEIFMSLKSLRFS